MTTPREHPAELGRDQLLDQCRVVRGRRSGPGGQHRNKVETAIRIVHLPTGVTSEATERRSQEENQQVAIQRLRGNLALRVRSCPPADATPSPRWSARLRSQRLAINPAHEDFPALLAEALDVIQLHQLDLKAAAAALQVTPSQLIRFLKHDPRALQLVNEGRAAAGLHRLH